MPLGGAVHDGEKKKFNPSSPPPTRLPAVDALAQRCARSGPRGERAPLDAVRHRRLGGGGGGQTRGNEMSSHDSERERRGESARHAVRHCRLGETDKVKPRPPHAVN